MLNLLKAGLVWAGLLLSSAAFGQEIPFGVLPMQYNGSFAGEAGASRLSTNTQYNTNGRNDVLLGLSEYHKVGTFLSYDQFVPLIWSGIGFTAGIEKKVFDVPVRDSKYYFAIDIAPKISIKGKYTLSPSVTINYFKQTVENEHDDPFCLRREGFGSRIGILWNSPKYYIGLALNGFSKYTLSYRSETFNANEVLPNRLGLTLQAGYTFQKNSESKFSVTPQLVLDLAGNNGTFIGYGSGYPWNSYGLLAGYHLNFRYSKIIWGLNNAGIHAGFQTDRLRLMVTDNLSVINGREYSSNLSFRYVFKEKSLRY